MKTSTTIGKISFDWDEDLIPNGPLTNVRINSQDDVTNKVYQILHSTTLEIGDPFRPGERKVEFPTEIEAICEDVFTAIKQLKTDGKNVIAGYLASRLFEGFSAYWIRNILTTGKHILGIGFWHKIIDYTKQWEQKNTPITIHKGTPYYFLGVNYFLLGDFDNAFVYFYSAIEDDKKLPEIGYPKKAPIYQTVTLVDNSFNQMYSYVVKPLRKILDGYIQNFQKDFDPNFSISDFDKKFLQNDNLEDISYFFVYNFMNLHDLNNKFRNDVLFNEFSKIKALDQFFNLVLVVDQILRHAHLPSKFNGKTMYHPIQWWSDKYAHISKNDFDTLIGINDLNLNDSTPGDVVEDLLKLIKNPKQGISKDVYVMLLAYHLRNHAGHNIDRHDVLISHYREILENLFYAIFLAVKTI